MTTCSKVVAIALTLGASAPLAAGEFSVGAGAGTLGLGLETGYAFNQHLGVRLGGYAFSMEDSGTESGINYDADLDLENIGATVDWYPFGGGFRVSAGWFATDNGLAGIARPDANGEYDIAGNTFTSAQVGALEADMELGSSAPFVGLGWLWGGADGGFVFGLDAGILFQDAPLVELSSTGGTLSDQPLLLDALATEEAEFQDNVDNFELYPVANLGVAYRF
jgi:hypothetical protein